MASNFVGEANVEHIGWQEESDNGQTEGVARWRDWRAPLEAALKVRLQAKSQMNDLNLPSRACMIMALTTKHLSR